MKMYYNGNSFRYFENLQSDGIQPYPLSNYFPVITENTISPLEFFVASKIEFSTEKNAYVQTLEKQEATATTLAQNLSQPKHTLACKFQQAFVEIDARSPRSARGIIISLVDGSFPTDEAQDLTPEQQQRIVNVGIMWELEEIAQVNREMQAELLALEITEDMTLEQAQEITLRIANAQPWLPWRE